MWILFLIFIQLGYGFDYKQYIHGRKHWARTTRSKFRSSQSRYASPPGVFVPREFIPIDNAYRFRSKAYSYSKHCTTLDPRQTKAFYEWKARLKSKSLGQPRSTFRTYRWKSGSTIVRDRYKMGF